MNDQFKKVSFLSALFIVPTVLCFMFYYFIVRKPIVNGNAGKIYKHLPIIGERTLKSNAKGGVDTVYHSVPAFMLTDQNNLPRGSKDYEKKVLVTDFFFADCKTICPKMAANLIIAQKKLDHLKRDFGIVSITVNPENDTPEKLKDYAKMVHADPEIWNFLTGNKDSIYKLALNGFLVNAMEDTSKVIPDFIHSEKIILLDKQRRIRGYYDGTSTAEINRLIDEVRVLLTEYPRNKR